jgi:hypothetical protein
MKPASGCCVGLTWEHGIVGRIRVHWSRHHRCFAVRLTQLSFALLVRELSCPLHQLVALCTCYFLKGEREGYFDLEGVGESEKGADKGIEVGVGLNEPGDSEG